MQDSSWVGRLVPLGKVNSEDVSRVGVVATQQTIFECVLLGLAAFVDALIFDA